MLKKLREKFSTPETSTRKISVSEIFRDETPPPLVEPDPCVTCGCPFFWRSVCDDRLHCLECTPRHPQMYRDVWLIVVEDDGSLGWELVRDRSGPVGRKTI